jgi:hypothetical protein
MTPHTLIAAVDDHEAVGAAQVDAGEHTTPDRFPAPTAGGSQGSTLVLAVGPFRDWLDEYMRARELTSADVARVIGRDESMVRGWFGVRGRDWRTQSQDRFVIHIISELNVEHVGIMLTGNPRLVPELYPHMAEPVCQRCGASTGCDHLGHHHQLAA